MKEKQAKNMMEMTRAEKRRRRRRRLFIRRATVIVVAMLLLAALVWGVIEIAKASKGKTTTFLGVKAIEVECVDGEGTVRYADEEIIRASGLYVDQSLLALNKVQASERVLAQFPYLDFVEVKNSSFSTVCIRVAEAEVLALVQHGEGWLVVGDNNHVLEQVAAESLPENTLQVIGAQPLSGDLRADALNEREWRITSTIAQAIAVNNATDITVIDMTTKTDLRLWWKDRVEIVLGNESNLAAQIAAFQQLLPTLISKNGESVSGQLNMSSYADDNTDNDRAVFTPIEGISPPIGPDASTENDNAVGSDAADNSMSTDATNEMTETTTSTT